LPHLVVLFPRYLASREPDGEPDLTITLDRTITLDETGSLDIPKARDEADSASPDPFVASP